jgi:hypothetical protein
MLMIGSGLRIAIAAQRPFEKLLAVGLTTLLGVQTFVILAGIVRLLPLTGVTLPFVSYGGSSLLGSWVMLALLLRISDDVALERGADAARATRRMRAGAREPPHSFPRHRPHGLLRGAVRAAQPDSTSSAPNGSRTTRRTPARSAGLQPTTGHDPTADGVVVATSVELPGPSCE